MLQYGYIKIKKLLSFARGTTKKVAVQPKLHGYMIGKALCF